MGNGNEYLDTIANICDDVEKALNEGYAPLFACLGMRISTSSMKDEATDKIIIHHVIQSEDLFVRDAFTTIYTAINDPLIIVKNDIFADAKALIHETFDDAIKTEMIISGMRATNAMIKCL